MTGKHLFTSEEKLKWWGAGEWVEELDEVDFEYKGVNCQIRRTCLYDGFSGDGHPWVFGGSLCGYIEVPEGHPWRQISYDQIEVSVHGDLTFGAESDQGKYWIGFDCAHSTDLIPSLEQIKKTHFMEEWVQDVETLKKRFFGSMVFHETYKNLEFVKCECQYLVDQMLAAKLTEDVK
jgi:hypothetical protein